MGKRSRRRQLVGHLALALALAACAPSEPPVGSVRVEPAEIPLRYPGFTEFSLTWSPESAIEERQGELRAAVHLLDEDGRVLRTFDHPLEFDWTPGATETRERTLFQSALAPPLEEGTYDLEIGLYDETGRAWEVESSAAAVRVESTTEGFPAFYFSPEWLPIEGGTDLQILGRRWLRADGLIRLGELSRPGVLWLQIGIPVAREGMFEMRLEEGASRPEVVVSGTCGVVSRTLAGSGSHHVRLAVTAGEDGALPDECEIAIDANYRLVSIDDQTRRTIALESLSWLTTS